MYLKKLSQSPLIALICILFISGCANITNDSEKSAPQPAGPAISSATSSTTPNSSDGKIQPAENTDFSPETLYSLLVAETAGHRSRLDVTLAQYLRQAQVTRDVKVVARANRVARYMRAQQATLDTALLWTEISPNSLEARNVATQQLLSFGRHTEALQQIDKVLDISDKADFELLVKSSARTTIEDRKQILAGIAMLIKKHPENDKLWLTQAFIQMQQKLDNEALLSTNTALKLNKKNIGATIAKANLLTKRKKLSAATALIKKAAKHNPEHIRLHLFYGELLIKQNNLKQADKLFQRMRLQYPEDSALTLSLGLLYFEHDLLPQAEPYFQQLIQTVQRSNEAHFYLGLSNEQKGNLNLAVTQLKKVSAGNKLPSARVRIAHLLNTLGHPDQAIESIQQDRKNHPELSLFFFLAESELLTEQKQIQSAYEVLEQALLQHAQNPQLLYSKAMIAEQLNKFDIMESDLSAVIELNPNNAAALNALGYTLADRGIRLNEALALIKKAYEITPNDPAIIDSMGWIQYRLGNHEIAISYLRTALEILPDQEIAAHLGEVLWVSGKQDQAKSVWYKALTETPDSLVLKTTMQHFIP